SHSPHTLLRYRQMSELFRTRWQKLWTRALSHETGVPRRSPRATSTLRIETLEDRITPATITWDKTAFPTGGNWNSTTSWVGGVVPTATDDAVIGLTTAGTVSLAADAPVNSVTTSSFTTLNTNNHALTLGTGSTTLGGPVSVPTGGHLTAGAGSHVTVGA